MGEKEWYFFCHKDRKYPTGTRTNRATESGYWKATGKDKEIFRRRGILISMKETLVFYRSHAPRGEKTGWVMHEFRLEGKLPHLLLHSAKVRPPLLLSCHVLFSKFVNFLPLWVDELNPLVFLMPYRVQDEWAVCKVFNKDLAATNGPMVAAGMGLEHISSFGFISDFLDSVELPPLMDPPFGADIDEVIDFKGPASTSGHATGVAGAHAAPGMSYLQQVKMEEPVPLQYNHHQQSHILYLSPYFLLSTDARSKSSRSYGRDTLSKKKKLLPSHGGGGDSRRH